MLQTTVFNRWQAEHDHCAAAPEVSVSTENSWDTFGHFGHIGSNVAAMTDSNSALHETGTSNHMSASEADVSRP